MQLQSIKKNTEITLYIHKKLTLILYWNVHVVSFLRPKISNFCKSKSCESIVRNLNFYAMFHIKDFFTNNKYLAIKCWVSLFVTFSHQETMCSAPSQIHKSVAIELNYFRSSSVEFLVSRIVSVSIHSLWNNFLCCWLLLFMGFFLSKLVLCKSIFRQNIK